MTINQITKKLQAANIALTGIEIKKDEVEIYVKTKSGEFSQHLTEVKNNKVAKVLGWGGYKCGYGAWVLNSAYRMDNNDGKASRMHY